MTYVPQTAAQYVAELADRYAQLEEFYAEHTDDFGEHPDLDPATVPHPFHAELKQVRTDLAMARTHLQFVREYQAKVEAALNAITD